MTNQWRNENKKKNEKMERNKRIQKAKYKKAQADNEEKLKKEIWKRKTNKYLNREH